MLISKRSAAISIRREKYERVRGLKALIISILMKYLDELERIFFHPANIAVCQANFTPFINVIGDQDFRAFMNYKKVDTLFGRAAFYRYRGREDDTGILVGIFPVTTVAQQK